MITYARNEIFSATEAAKRFGAILEKFQNKSLARAVVSKNNRIEAVILPVEAYEEMKVHSLKDVLRESKIDYETL
jgi:PHD/YefM family antitoxin component YafN of YafNO toxin-antitoxin module